MESPGDYIDAPMNDEDLAYPCKGCGEILEEGKAFELAGNRWHLDCFRCNTCGTLLDSDANLLLLGDGSLICNNCTYSCSACGNKIEDLAILTGDQAFCATCFRCRNCKRKIENLRYARTSQGIFCMSCHESLMARRRKKSRAAAQQKAKKDEQSPMLVDKSLPALPPSAIEQVPFSPEREAPDSDKHTELSPRPRPTYGRSDSDSQGKDTLTLPTTTYRKNRHSVISQASEGVGGDGESFFIPLALDPSPAPSVTPRSASDTWQDSSKRSRENKGTDHVTSPKAAGRTAESGSAPHIAFQEKGRQASADALEASQQQIKESIRKAQQAASRKGASSKSDDTKVQHANSPGSVNGNDKNQGQTEKFRLGDVPKSKKSSTSKNSSSTEVAANESPISRSTSSGGFSTVPPRKEVGTESPKSSVTADKTGNRPRSKDEADTESSTTSTTPSRGNSGAKSIPRKEIASNATKNNEAPVNLSSETDTSSSSPSSSDTPGVTPTMNGKSTSGHTFLQSPIEEEVIPNRAPNRPHGPQQQLSDTYMTPRAPPPPPSGSHIAGKESTGASNGAPVSPKLPRWSAGGDFTMDEDLARILGGTDESSQSILRRVSNAVRHGRTTSETSNSARHQGHGRSISETTRTTASPRWPKTPVGEEANIGAREISSPISITSPSASDDPALLRRRLRNSEQRVAELERQFATEKDLKDLNKKLIEKRKTVSVLDSQSEIMIRQVEVLAGYVEKAKASKQPLNISELEDSAIKEFVQKLEHLKLGLSGQIEELYEERNELLEEKNQITADRDRALVEFEQLSSKNAQLADMNNDLTHQIQERFKAQSGGVDSPRNGNPLGIYTHQKDKSSASFMDDATTVRSGSTTIYNSEQDPTIESGTVLPAPHVINIRKGQAKKFNWKKGGQTVAKGVSKGFKGAFSSGGQERNQWAGQTGESIGLPYNMTVTAVEAPANFSGTLPRSTTIDPSRQGFGLFKKSNNMGSKSASNAAAAAAAENPAVLFGSELVDRADYERRQIPSVVTRCIEEVELRGMDVEGIYRKTGGSGQVKIIQEGFDKTEDYDISDPDLDITAVTSVLKQYFRKLPTPLLTFDIYDRVLESTTIEDDQERCDHLRKTFATLPPKHRDCLEFLIFHLARVAQREKENLMTPKNLAVVFAPTIMRDMSIEREMTDTHAKNNAVQFIIENSNEIFSSA
ncbi:hypothetical protein B7463_g641, partial [Scytalidium lignicola]